ncbi:hypothetical protein HK101_002143 [Irineochytrium annulatum]|nr:hypothetical protein HK101_002143 [Irineochytrium annulatum]
MATPATTTATTPPRAAPAEAPTPASPASPAHSRPHTIEHQLTAETLVSTINMEEVHGGSHVRHKKAALESSMTIHEVITLHGSVIPSILIPCAILTLWSVPWVVLYTYTTFRSWAIGPTLITVMGVVMGLLLVFRTNTAYDRYWEGRKLWSVMVTNARNACRCIWILTSARTPEEERVKRGAINLVLAFMVSCKHYIRGNKKPHYDDLCHLLVHVPSLNPLTHPNPHNLPLEILYHLTSFVKRGVRSGQIDVQTQLQLLGAVASFTDCLSSFERIRNTPVPLAYNIHLKTCLVLYLASLPFQLVQPLFWMTVPVVAIASFTFFGLESVAGEIENPFGLDANDLAIDDFLDSVREEYLETLSKDSKRDPMLWNAPKYNLLNKKHDVSDGVGVGGGVRLMTGREGGVKLNDDGGGAGGGGESAARDDEARADADREGEGGGLGIGSLLWKETPMRSADRDRVMNMSAVEDDDVAVVRDVRVVRMEAEGEELLMLLDLVIVP